MSKKTTIWIDVEAREYIKDIGKKGDTYNDIIHNLIDMHKNMLLYDEWQSKHIIT